MGAAQPDDQPGGALCRGHVYDSLRQRVVLFGGTSASNSRFADLWEWDGTSWTALVSAAGPSARSKPGLAHDSARARIVLFGGETLGVVSTETWEWDGSSWLLRAPATSPPQVLGLNGNTVAYDEVRARTVLTLSGQTQMVPYTIHETWEWDGSQWTKRDSSTARGAAALVYDRARRLCVTFGGWWRNANSYFAAETYEWDGVAWSFRSPASIPAARDGYAMAYDQARGRIVLFGGAASTLSGTTYFSDVWEYAPTFPARLVALGTGCPGPGGVPTLSGDRGSLPWIGSPFTALLPNLGTSPTTKAAVLLGDSKSQWGSLALPLTSRRTEWRAAGCMRTHSRASRCRK